MKTKNQNLLTQYAIPDGEGSTALPIAFFNVIVRAKPEAISHLTGKAFLSGIFRLTGDCFSPSSHSQPRRRQAGQ